MRSMTGFGSVQIPTQHARIRIEVSSLNKRGLEVIVFTPGAVSYTHLTLPTIYSV